jgi:hypothetical protein
MSISNFARESSKAYVILLRNISIEKDVIDIFRQGKLFVHPIREVFIDFEKIILGEFSPKGPIKTWIGIKRN